MDAWVVGLRGVCHIPSQHKKKSDQRMMWMSLVSGMVSLWACCVSSMAGESQEPASPAAPAYPDVDAMPVIWDDTNEYWLLDPYARIPRVLDQVQPAGRPPVIVEP